MAAQTLVNVVARVRQLYEPEREKPEGSSTLGAYVRRWVRWVRAGVPWLSPVRTTWGEAPSLTGGTWYRPAPRGGVECLC